MRIALFTDTFPPTLNGVSRALGLLVDHALEAGHEVLVVAPEADSRAGEEGASSRAGVEEIRIPGPELPFYRELRAARPWLGSANRKRLEAFRPDLVHAATEASVGLLGRQWALSEDVPLVTSYCTNFPEYAAGYHLGFLEAGLWRYLQWFHDAARGTFVPSDATRSELLARGFHDRIRIWGRGVDSELFHPERADPGLRDRMAPGADVVLVHVGRLAPEKRVDLLLDALPEVRRSTDRRVALVFVGGGPAEEELKTRAATLPDAAGDDIHFAGYRRGTELAAHFASGDVFVFASDTETFGQVVTEAMASGLPVVAPAKGGVLDTVVPGTTGLLFPPGDASGLAEAVTSLVADRELRETLGRNARESALTRSWSAVFRTLFRDYRELAGGVRRPAPPAPGRHTNVTR